MTESRQLLADYAEKASEPAFAELVRRYLDLVYSTAIRLTGGDSHLAEDVAQTVFADLARRSTSLSREVLLGGWLHRHTCYVAATVMRGERRRQERERQSMNVVDTTGSEDRYSQLAPVLDEAINRLSATDRAAIMLRFFEQCDFRAIGAALGTTDDAAQKRVSRALEKLRSAVARRGIALTGTALGTFLAGQAVTAAPAGLAASVSATALASSAAAGGITLSLFKIMTMTKLKAAALGAALAVTIGVPVAIERQSDLRDENQSLRSQALQLATVRDQNAQLSNQLAVLQQEASLYSTQLADLMRLRGEVAGLRRQKDELDKAREENRQLRALQTARPAAPPELEAAEPKDNYPRESWAFVGYANPESAFQTAVWAMSNSDINNYLASLSPNSREREQREWAGKSELEIAAKLKRDFEEGTPGKVKGFRILKKEFVSDDEVVLTLFVDGLGPNEGTPRMKLQRVGNEWRLDGPQSRRN